MAQVNTHTQRDMNNAWSDMVTSSSPPLPFTVLFLLGSYNEYGMFQLSLPTNHVGLLKLYSFSKLLTITILKLRAT